MKENEINFFEQLRAKRLNSYEIYKRGLCLPSSTLNSEGDIRYIGRTIKEILKGA